MTQAVGLPLPTARSSEIKFVGAVCFVHFVSHFYIMLLAPLFLFIRADYNVSYTELGLALTAFNVVSTLLQTPAGFLVDRGSPRLVLIAGLLFGAGAIAVAGLVDSFWVFVAMFGVAGLANTAYHPADYALLSRYVPGSRLGQVFSFHTFAGMLGNAAAPPILLYLHSLFGWRNAFIGAAALSLVGVAVLMWYGEPPFEPEKSALKEHTADQGDVSHGGWRLLMSPAILLNLVFFILLSVANGGLSNFMVPALGALHGTSPAVANAALTGLLILSAAGVLVGGSLAGLTDRHVLVAACGLMATAILSLLIGLIDFPAMILVTVMSLSGFCSGITMPSRDMIVRAATPPGAYGLVFGFVSTGFNIGGIISPLIFGQLLDHGQPATIFLLIAACTFLSIATVAIPRRAHPAARPLL